MSAATIPVTRQGKRQPQRPWASDVQHSGMGPLGRGFYRACCECVKNRKESASRSWEDDIAFPGIQWIADWMAVSRRSAERGLAEAEEFGYVGVPYGRSGGRPSHNPAKSSDSFTKYHLHPDGIPCEQCRAARESRQGNKPKPKPFITTITVPESVPESVPNRVVHIRKISKEPTMEPTTASGQPKPSGPMLVAALSSQKINLEAKTTVTGNTTDTNTIRPRTPEVAFASEAEKSWVLAAFRLHPKKLGDKSAAFSSLQSIYRDPESRYVFDVNHPLWCKTKQWQKENYRYCPRIPAFIESEQYLDPPTESDHSANDGYYEVPEL